MYKQFEIFPAFRSEAGSNGCYMTFPHSTSRPRNSRLGSYAAARPRAVKSALWVIACIAFLLVTRAPARAAGDDAPEWLRQAASTSLGSYDKSVPAVVLWDEQTATVEADGRVVVVSRWAVKVLNREGRREANGVTTYATDSEKVRDFQAWLIRPSGTVKHYKKDQVLDLAAKEDDVYNEVRLRAVVADEDADEGAIFGYESILERKQVFSQFDWSQSRLPVALFRITLNVPGGWQADSVTFNHSKIEPRVTGTSWVWELHDLPYINKEPSSPPESAVAPRLAVSYFPPDKGGSMARAFNDWTDVSKWLSELIDPQSAPNEAITQKARSLTTGAATEMDRIKAIAGYVQTTHYVSIQTGLGRGGGYRPHAAADIFAKSYGDCKDKANLMRAMLKAIGIESFPVSICADDPLYVRKEWPSPQQFNHCIIAIKVRDETRAATIIEHSTLGRLLIFDPTDPDTPVGDLPGDEQGSMALIIAGDAGRLMKMPVTPSEANLVTRRVEATLSPDGSLTATISQESTGQAAVRFRAMSHHLTPQDFTKAMNSWITSGVSGAKIAKFEPNDDRAANRYKLSIQLSSDNYGQLMQGRLLVFRPTMVSKRDSQAASDSSRKQPVLVSSDALDEEVKIKLPAGFEVDEMPDPVKLQAPFGRYATSYQVQDGYLIFKRSLATETTIVAAENYGIVKGFYGRIRAAESAPVVLAKK